LGVFYLALTHWQYIFDGVPNVYTVATIVRNVGIINGGQGANCPW
jgi:hypothetical protein